MRSVQNPTKHQLHSVCSVLRRKLIRKGKYSLFLHQISYQCQIMRWKWILQWLLCYLKYANAIILIQLLHLWNQCSPYLSNIILLMAIAYALGNLYSNTIPPAIVHNFFTVCSPTASRSVDTMVGQYLPSPLPALCVWICFSNSNWNFNCNED